MYIIMFHFKNKATTKKTQHTFPSLNREGAGKEHAIVFPESRSVAWDPFNSTTGRRKRNKNNTWIIYLFIFDVVES